MIYRIKEIALLILVLALTACQDKVNRTNGSNALVKEDQTEFAQTLSEKILMAQKDGGFYKLNQNEAIRSMVNGLNESVQKSAYKQIKSLYGDYEGLNFHSIKEITKDKTYEIYRFKGVFESGLDVEVRAVLNTEGKLAGFFIKPWQEAL